MSYFSERKGLKSAFVFAAMASILGGYSAYSIVEEDKPNPMAMVFSGLFVLMAGSSYKQYRQESKAAQQNQTPKP